MKHISDCVFEQRLQVYVCQLLYSAVSSSGWSHISRLKVSSHSSSKVETVQESVIGISCGPLLTPQRSVRAAPEKASSQHSKVSLLLEYCLDVRKTIEIY